MMRKIVSLIFLLGILGLVASPLYAGGIINKQNQSADYMRTLNRHAATDYADIAVYNPAGIMQMDDGGYAKLDIMYFAKDYSNTVPGFGKLDQDEPSIIPGAFAIYKQDKWAGFFALTIPAGGGQLKFEQGDARTVALGLGIANFLNVALALPPVAQYDTIRSQSIEVKESTVYGFTLGGALKQDKVFFFTSAERIEEDRHLDFAYPPATPDFILEREPDWSAIPPDTPPPMR